MIRASICTLDQALDFYDDNIIERFLGIYNTTPEETHSIGSYTLPFNSLQSRQPDAKFSCAHR